MRISEAGVALTGAAEVVRKLEHIPDEEDDTKLLADPAAHAAIMVRIDTTVQ